MGDFNVAHLVAKAARAEIAPHDLTWQRANQIAAFEVPEGERIRCWIDKLSPGQIAALQHPDDDDKRNALCNALSKDSTNGKLGQLKMFHNVDAPYDPLTVDYVGFVKPEHRYRIPVGAVQGWFQDHREIEQPSEHILAWFAANTKAEHRYRIPVGAIQRWFQDHREIEHPSEHILAWFAANTKREKKARRTRKKVV